MTRIGLPRLRAVVAGLAITVLLGGCGMLGGSGGGQASGGGGQSSEGSGQTDAGAGAEQQPPATPQIQDVLEASAVATGTMHHDGGVLEVEVVSLKRTSDRMVRLDLRVTAVNDLSYHVMAYFTDDGGTLNTVDSLTLLDEDAGKRYLVVHDSEGACLCSTGQPLLDEGETGVLYAYFPAAPASTTAINVLVPHMVPFDEVPISG